MNCGIFQEQFIFGWWHFDQIRVTISSAFFCRPCRPIQFLINRLTAVSCSISVSTHAKFTPVENRQLFCQNIKCWQFGFNSSPAARCNEDLGRTQYQMLPLEPFSQFLQNANFQMITAGYWQTINLWGLAKLAVNTEKYMVLNFVAGNLRFLNDSTCLAKSEMSVIWL